MRKNPSDLKFLIVSALTVPFTAGGGKNAFSFARFLVHRSGGVSLLTLNPGTSLPGVEINQGVRIIRKHVSRKNRIMRLFFYLIMSPALISHVRRSDVIIIYGRYFPLYGYIIILGSIFRKHIIFRSTLIGEDDMDSLFTGGRINVWMRKRIFSMISMYFSLTPDFSNRFKKHFASIPVFENIQGVDIDDFYPISLEERADIKSKLHLPGDIPILISVGSPIERKGYIEICNVLKGIKESFIYLIAGETDLSLSPHLLAKKDEINQIITSAKKLLGEKLRFIGVVDDLNSWLNISDYFILNSSQEGFPNSLLECLASGTIPVIRASVGWVDNIIKDGENAVIYRDMYDFESKIKQLLKNPTLLVDPGNSSLEMVRREISFETTHRRLISLIP